MFLVTQISWHFHNHYTERRENSSLLFISYQISLLFIITLYISNQSIGQQWLESSSKILYHLLLKMCLLLQRSYDDDVKQHGERGSTCHQEREQTGDTLMDNYTSHPPGAK